MGDLKLFRLAGGKADEIPIFLRSARTTLIPSMRTLARPVDDGHSRWWADEDRRAWTVTVVLVAACVAAPRTPWRAVLSRGSDCTLARNTSWFK